MIFGQLAKAARVFAQFYACTRKSLWDFWPRRLEQPIKFVFNSIAHFGGIRPAFSLHSLRPRYSRADKMKFATSLQPRNKA